MPPRKKPLNSEDKGRVQSSDDGTKKKQKDKWTEEEDRVLLENYPTYAKHSDKWKKLAKIISEECNTNRNGKQVGERKATLDNLPKVHGERFTEKELKYLMTNYKEMGPTKMAKEGMLAGKKSKDQIKNKFGAET